MEALLKADYTMQELMVVAGAREIRDDDVVFVGMSSDNKIEFADSHPF